MAVTPAEVRRVAALARLPLEPGEVEAMTRQLNRILEHVDALADADAEGGPGDAGPADDDAGRAPLRADEPGADPLAIPPSALAPAWVDGFFTVPRLASHDDSDDVDDLDDVVGGRDGPEGDRTAP